MLVRAVAEHDTPTQVADEEGLGPSESSGSTGPDGAGLETQRLRAAIGSRLFGDGEVATTTATKIGRHTLLEPLGSGGMGLVYTAYDPQLDRRVAIKVLHAGASAARRERASKRLLAEAQAMAKLNHPNVIAVHDAGVEDGRVFIAMECVDGGTLGSWCEAHPPSDRARFDAALDLLLQAARGLVAAHAAGLVHRDLKPANMLVDRQGRLRVADFGLARVHADDVEPPVVVAADDVDARPDGPTPRTDVAGTPAYMAPEQFEGRSDARSDQWSWCATAWEAVFGQRPFPGSSLVELISARDRGAPPVPRSRTEVPGWFCRVLERGLTGDPAARYPSMSALLRDLDRRRRRPRRIASVAGVAALVGVAALGWTGRSVPPPEISRCDELVADLEGVYDTRTRVEILDAVETRHGKVARGGMERPLSRLDAYAERWLSGAQSACRDLERDRELADGVAVIDQAQGSMRCFRGALDELEVVVAEERTAPQLVGAYGAVDALLPLDRCRHATGQAVVESGSARVIARWLAQGNILVTLDDHTAARAALQQAEDLFDVHTSPTQKAKLYYQRAIMADREGDHAESMVEGRKALTWAERGGDRHVVTLVWLVLADASLHEERYDEASFYVQRATTLLEAIGRPPWLTGSVLRASAAIAHGRGDHERALADLDEAIALFEPIYGKDSTATSRLRDAKISVLRALGRREDAIASGRRALLAFERRYGPRHPQTARAMGRIAGVLTDMGDLPGAIELYRRAHDILIDDEDVDPSDRATVGFLLAQALGDAHQFDEANQTAATTRALAVQTLGPAHPMVNMIDLAAASIALDAGDNARAIEMYERLVRLDKGNDLQNLAVNDHVLCMNLAVAYARAERPADATAQLQRCDALALEIEPPNPLHFPASDRWAGEVLQRAGQPKRARERYVRAAETFDAEAPDRLDRAFAHLGIVEIDLAGGDGEGLDARLDVVARLLERHAEPGIEARYDAARAKLDARQSP